MKILNTMCRVGNQGNFLEHYPKRQATITPCILCISLLALLTGCSVEIKPDKPLGGTTGNHGPLPPYSSPIGPVYDPVYSGPFTSTDGGYGPGTQPVSNSSSNRQKGGGITIKLTSS